MNDDVFEEFSDSIDYEKTPENTPEQEAKTEKLRTLQRDYMINNCRVITATYLDDLVGKLIDEMKSGNKKRVEYELNRVVEFYIASNLNDEDYTEEHIAKVFENLSVKSVLGYDYQDVYENITNLAKQCCVDAVCDYLLVTQKSDYDEEILNFAKNIEKKQQKTPEDWKICACLHSQDEVTLFGSDYENITNIDELITTLRDIISQKNKAKRYRNLDKYLELESKSNYMFSVLKEQPYTMALRNAQLGFYRRYFKDQNLSDLNQYSTLVQYYNIIVVPPKVMASYSGGKLYECDDVAKILKKISKEDMRKKQPNFENEYFLYKFFALNSPDDMLAESAIMNLATLGTIAMSSEKSASKAESKTNDEIFKL